MICLVEINGWIPTRRFQPIIKFIPNSKPVSPRAPKPHQTKIKCPTVLASSIPIRHNVVMTPDEQEVQVKSALDTSNTLPSEIPVKETICKSIGLMQLQSEYMGRYAAIPLLSGYAEDGVQWIVGPIGPMNTYFWY